MSESFKEAIADIIDNSIKDQTSSPANFLSRKTSELLKEKSQKDQSTEKVDKQNSIEIVEKPSFEIIDESDPDNVLSDKSRKIVTLSTGVFPYSNEGFAENPEKQSSIAKFLISKLGIQQRGPLLDVGFGSNIHIANEFSRQGIESFAIDEQQYNSQIGESLWQPPKFVNENKHGVKIYSGDIADIGKDKSVLKNNKFGLVLFNGSWSSGGNNWTVAGEVMEAKHYNQQSNATPLNIFMDKERTQILSACKNQLEKDGLIGIVSSRYAFHGAGYSFNQLPQEKLEFLDAIQRLRGLGAKRFYIVGLSNRGFEEVSTIDTVKNMQEIRNIQKQMMDITSLPNTNIYNNEERIKSVKEATSKYEDLANVTRIDAIFAEF